ncbi:MAG: hypothetical protein KC416_01505 [Myxococcales bacterium]|nr:hypothetical protein [Myxococcales bacterium]
MNFRVANLILQGSYELLHAMNDREACRILEERGKDLYVILMDIQLVGSQLDGVEITRLVRGTLPDKDIPPYARGVPSLPDTPVLFLTAYGSMYPESVLRNAGGNKLLTKPVNATSLELALTSFHLGRAGINSTNPPHR